MLVSAVFYITLPQKRQLVNSFPRKHYGYYNIYEHKEILAVNQFPLSVVPDGKAIYTTKCSSNLRRDQF